MCARSRGPYCFRHTYSSKALMHLFLSQVWDNMHRTGTVSAVARPEAISHSAQHGRSFCTEVTLASFGLSSFYTYYICPETEGATTPRSIVQNHDINRTSYMTLCSNDSTSVLSCSYAVLVVSHVSQGLFHSVRSSYLPTSKATNIVMSVLL